MSCLFFYPLFACVDENVCSGSEFRCFDQQIRFQARNYHLQGVCRRMNHKTDHSSWFNFDQQILESNQNSSKNAANLAVSAIVDTVSLKSHNKIVLADNEEIFSFVCTSLSSVLSRYIKATKMEIDRALILFSSVGKLQMYFIPVCCELSTVCANCCIFGHLWRTTRECTFMEAFAFFITVSAATPVESMF